MPIKVGSLRTLAEMMAEHSDERLPSIMRKYPVLKQFNPRMKEIEAELLIENNRVRDGAMSRLIDKYGVTPPKVLYRAQTTAGDDLAQNTRVRPSKEVRSAATNLRSVAPYLNMEMDEEIDAGFSFPKNFMQLRPAPDYRAIPQPFVDDGLEWLLPRGTYMDDVQPYRLSAKQREALSDDTELLKRLRALRGTLKRVK